MPALDVLVEAGHRLRVRRRPGRLRAPRSYVRRCGLAAATPPTDIVHDSVFTAAFRRPPEGRRSRNARRIAALLDRPTWPPWSDVRAFRVVGRWPARGVDPAAFAAAVGGGAARGLTGPSGGRPVRRSPPAVATRVPGDTAARRCSAGRLHARDPRLRTTAEVGRRSCWPAGKTGADQRGDPSRRACFLNVSGGGRAATRDSGVWRDRISTAPGNTRHEGGGWVFGRPQSRSRWCGWPSDRGSRRPGGSRLGGRGSPAGCRWTPSRRCDVMLYGNTGLDSDCPGWTLAGQSTRWLAWTPHVPTGAPARWSTVLLHMAKFEPTTRVRAEAIFWIAQREPAKNK